jgi:hypothetical protein
MPRDTKVFTEKLSPSASMRQLPPELYSDTADRTTYQLNAPTLGYHLETITARNQTHDLRSQAEDLVQIVLVRPVAVAGLDGGSGTIARSLGFIVIAVHRYWPESGACSAFCPTCIP